MLSCVIDPFNFYFDPTALRGGTASKAGDGAYRAPKGCNATRKLPASTLKLQTAKPKT